LIITQVCGSISLIDGKNRGLVMRNKVTVMVGALSLLMAGITPAQAQEASAADKLRRLDIMLMVTSLRCRNTEDNFQTDFAQFEGRHMKELNAAAAELRKNAGPQADKALDKISTTIANKFGAGHPFMNCHDLKDLTHRLAEVEGAAVLLEAADRVFAAPPLAPSAPSAIAASAPPASVAAAAP